MRDWDGVPMKKKGPSSSFLNASLMLNFVTSSGGSDTVGIGRSGINHGDDLRGNMSRVGWIIRGRAISCTLFGGISTRTAYLFFGAQ